MQDKGAFAVANLPFSDVKASSLSLDRYQSSLKSAFNQKVSVQHFNGGLSDTWTGLFTLPIKSGQDVATLKAWLFSLRGRVNTFDAYDPDRRTPNGTATAWGGSILVAGGSQVGRSINVDGLPLSETGFLLAGDYIQIGTGYHMVTEDVDTSGTGTATINFEAIMRSSPANNSTVIYNNPVMVARLADPSSAISTNLNKMTSFSFAFEEAI